MRVLLFKNKPPSLAVSLCAYAVATAAVFLVIYFQQNNIFGYLITFLAGSLCIVMSGKRRLVAMLICIDILSLALCFREKWGGLLAFQLCQSWLIWNAYAYLAAKIMLPLGPGMSDISKNGNPESREIAFYGSVFISMLLSIGFMWHHAY